MGLVGRGEVMGIAWGVYAAGRRLNRMFVLQHVTQCWLRLNRGVCVRAGDRERSLGLPVSLMCDRNKASVPKNQRAFIEFVVKPSLR